MIDELFLGPTSLQNLPKNAKLTLQKLPPPTLNFHSPNQQLSIMVDATDSAIGSVLHTTTSNGQHLIPENLHPLKVNTDQLKPVATTSHDNKKVFVHPALETCSHLFVCHDAVKKPLQVPYDEPYLVLKRNDTMFTIEKNGKQSTINIDRLRPAFFENSHHSSAPTISPPPVAVLTSTKPVPDPSPSSLCHLQILLHYLM
ncbi:retrovirus-related Pol polyprotein from transposon 412 [Trichonephila clavata]|uniref:Retrovirus-related Pol polyprotein from transposon 412 n=1 Tax=Trichonephila clavata TaxID=2740835 RepID=A0A8X6F5E4_TRICU|nr:retrovirus-related Pol polyprotein from transposon 412 [Trichonephila clavata]